MRIVALTKETLEGFPLSSMRGHTEGAILVDLEFADALNLDVLASRTVRNKFLLL